MENGVSRTTKTNRHWMAYTLIFSLGLNLLVAGMVGSLLLRGGTRNQHVVERSIAVLGLRPFYRALDAADRRAIITSMRTNKAKSSFAATSMKAHLLNMAKAIETKPFNEDAMVAELAKLRTEITHKLAFGHRLLLNRLREMTPERRALFANSLRKPQHRRLKRLSFKRRN